MNAGTILIAETLAERAYLDEPATDVVWWQHAVLTMSDKHPLLVEDPTTQVTLLMLQE